ncbi:MAG: MFS transporter [Pseudomonadota bacterium]
MSDTSVAETESAVSTDTPEGYGSAGYRAYVLFALLIVYIFNFIDRSLISVLGEPIRETFALSDLQIGLLSGLAFAVLYTVLGIPFAMLAERRSRTWIISIALAAWSAMTVACGMAQNTFQFALARIGVGVGEAGCSPPSHSLISDYFPPEKRASALGIFALGIPIGTMIAALGAAWIEGQPNMNWRDAFIIMGIPGILLAVFFKMTIKEPPRGFSDPGGAAAAAARQMPSPTKVFGVVGRMPSFWHVSLGGALASFVGYGVGQFVPPFWMRVHGLSLQDAALIFGGVLGIAAAVGTFGSGWVADRVRARHPNSDSWLPALGLSLSVPIAILGYNTLAFAEGSMAIMLAIPLLSVAAVLRFAYLAPMFAVTQKLVEPRMRATAAALLLFVVNLIGYGAGPPVIGALSDHFTRQTLVSLEAPVTIGECATTESLLKATRDGTDRALSGAELDQAVATNTNYCAPARKAGVRWGISIGLLFLFWAALHFLLLGRSMKNDLWTPEQSPATA